MSCSGFFGYSANKLWITEPEQPCDHIERKDVKEITDGEIPDIVGFAKCYRASTAGSSSDSSSPPQRGRSEEPPNPLEIYNMKLRNEIARFRTPSPPHIKRFVHLRHPPKIPSLNKDTQTDSHEEELIECQTPPSPLVGYVPEQTPQPMHTSGEREREYSWCAGYRCPLSYLAMHMQGHSGIDGREPVALQEELEHAFGEDVTSVAY